MDTIQTALKEMAKSSKFYNKSQKKIFEKTWRLVLFSFGQNWPYLTKLLELIKTGFWEVDFG